ncbi:hypothetical protein KC331_g5957 [Hortaea werneckii]|uniref:Anaphase-promoting complex subunit 4 WD40 domain-containing protein n=1 Tax=Hortaea werneckii TaxID=91943 RepID=A0A3M7CAW6_HORWE|nr:hypothetical protein KC331_g5957 [Hortaea werneckii]KAI7712688.1 hypothetical protein KC353_g8091 [Hortaea werneckii]RMY49114.1 hypothetical protein D0865_07686 [Hortaea werneckii]
MAPPHRPRLLKKSDLPSFLKPLKPTLFSESSAPPSSRYSQPLVQKIADISWSPTGSSIATCTSSNIRVWNSGRPNVKSSTEIRNAHPRDGGEWGRSGVSGDGVEKVAFSPRDEGMLASLGADGMVRLWDLKTPNKAIPVGDCKVPKQGGVLVWHPEGHQILVTVKSSNEVHQIDVRRLPTATSDPLQPVRFTLEPASRTPDAPHTVYTNLAFSNSGRELFATTTNAGVQILDYPSLTHLHSLSAFPGETHCVEHSPSGAHVAAGSADSTISLWDTNTWLTAHTLSHSQQLMPIRSFGFSFDGAYMVAGSGDHLGTMGKTEGGGGSSGLHIYHVDSGDVVHTIETTNCPTHVAWHPSRYWIAYAGDPGGLRVVGIGSNVL